MKNQRVILSLIVILFFGAITYGMLRNNGLNYIQRHTGVHLPKKNFSKIAVVDSGDNFVVAHVQLSAGVINEFGRKYPFRKYQKQRVKNVFGLYFLKDHFHMASLDQRLVLEGHNDSWSMILDKRSGDLWMIAFYPEKEKRILEREARENEDY